MIFFSDPFRAKDNFTFKCHRSNGTNTTNPQDIYAVSCVELYNVYFRLCVLYWILDYD